MQADTQVRPSQVPRENEYPLCALCGSSKRQVIYARMRDVRYGRGGEFTVCRCADCDLVYLCPRPQPEQLAQHYPPEYEPYRVKSWTSTGESWARMWARELARHLYRMRFGNETATLAPFGQQRLLDVGCGSGWYLCEMQQLGWHVFGVDTSPVAVQAARELVGASSVSLGTLETLDPRCAEFDLITMSHVLEHVADPRALLRESYRRLAPDGKLRVIVPDVSGFEARLFGRYWFGLDIPRHLYQFSKSTLSELLRQSGFHIESSRPQFVPRLWTRSFERVLELALHLRHARARHILAEPLLLLAAVSYVFGNRGAIDTIAGKSRG